MLGEKKTKVFIVAQSKIVQRVISEFGSDEGIILQFIDPADIGSADLTCDIFVADHVLFAERNFRMKGRLEASCPSALTLCIVNPGEEIDNLGDIIDWTISYSDLRRGIHDAIKVLQIIRRKAERGVLFDELLTVSRTVKHDACNSLAIACGAAGRLKKVPGIVDNTFYKQLLESHEQLTERLDKLVEIHEKYKSAGYYKKKG